MLKRPNHFRLVLVILYSYQIAFAAEVPSYNVSGRRGNDAIDGTNQIGPAGR